MSLSPNASGQDTIPEFTSFTKGRLLVALGGSISSSTDNRIDNSSGQYNVLNNYSVNARMAKVLARNFAFGLSFSTEKFRSSHQLLEVDQEVLMLGPWGAYYFTNGQPGGIFIQGGAYFVNYYEHSEFKAITPIIEEYAQGKGFAGAIGFGYTYVVFDRIGLEVSMVYSQAKIYGEMVNTAPLNISSNSEFNRINVMFQFGFTVLFDKIRDE